MDVGAMVNRPIVPASEARQAGPKMPVGCWRLAAPRVAQPCSHEYRSLRKSIPDTAAAQPASVTAYERIAYAPDNRRAQEMKFPPAAA
jgi:hypothetical protein